MTCFQQMKCRRQFSVLDLENNFKQIWSEGTLSLSLYLSIRKCNKPAGWVQLIWPLTLDDNLRAWYLIYKLLVCIFFWSSIIYTWSQTSSASTYFVWVTNWGICMLCATILLETTIITVMYLSWNPNSTIMLGHLYTKLSSGFQCLIEIQSAGQWSTYSTPWPSSSRYSIGRCCTTPANHLPISTSLYMDFRQLRFLSRKYLKISVTGSVCGGWSVHIEEKMVPGEDLFKLPSPSDLPDLQCDLLGCWRDG